MEHRFTIYKQVTTVTGVIDISGVAYNYWMRHMNIDLVPGAMDSILAFGATNQQCGYTSTWSDDPLQGWIIDTSYGSCGFGYTKDTNEPSFPAWNEITVKMDINHASNGNEINTIRLETTIGYLQVKFTKVSDGIGVLKEDTHELKMSFRLYSERYT